VEVGLGQFLEDRRQRGHNARQDDALHSIRADPFHPKKIQEQDAVLVGGLGVIRAHPPVGQEFGAVEDAPDDVRVTDVNGQQHALQRREASACGFRSREVLAERRSN